MTTFDQGTTPSLLHHNAHSIFSDDSHGLIYVGTMRGVTVMNPSMNSSDHFELPSGVDLLDLYMWSDGGDDGVLLLSTTSGLMTLALDVDGQISSVVDDIETEALNLMVPIQTGSGGQVILLGFGADQSVWRVTLDSQGLIGSPTTVVQLTAALQQQENTTVETAVHVVLPNEGPRLFVGTDRGLLMANSSDFVGGFESTWIFDISNAEDFVMPADAIDSALAARVQALFVDGPRDANGDITSPQTLWVGTRGGVHQFDLIVGPSTPLGAFSYDRMNNDEEFTANDVLSILPLGDEVIIGSQWGSWALDADHTRSSGVEPDHTRIPGRIVDMTVLDIDGQPFLFAALDPGVYANMVLIDPLSNDSDADGMPDGWEFIFGLDPTNPFDRDDDPGAD
ncbi:MAG: hypothetical protein NZ802_09060, partial [Candidatus Poseidoniales archaeon]|nr:hypothetical protein [Candidatus Poseidoniales archaeon]